MKKVLLIDDEENRRKQWEEELRGDGYEVTCAQSIEEATRVFPAHQWDAVVVDGCIGGNDFNSPPLIRMIKANVKGGCPIIAATRNPDLANEMIQAGCTHAIRTKDAAPGFVHSILRRQK